MRLYPLKPLQSSHSFTGAVGRKNEFMPRISGSSVSVRQRSSTFVDRNSLVDVPKPRPPKKVRTVSSSIGSFRGGRDDRFSLPRMKSTLGLVSSRPRQTKTFTKPISTSIRSSRSSLHIQSTAKPSPRITTKRPTYSLTGSIHTKPKAMPRRQNDKPARAAIKASPLPLKSASTTSRRQRSNLSYLPAQQPTYEALMLKQKLADQRRYVYALNEIMTQYDHEKFQRI